MLKTLRIEDIAGKTKIEVDGLWFDMDAVATFSKGNYTHPDMTSLDIDDVAIITDQGELLYLEGFRIPIEVYNKIEKAVTAAALKMAENTPDHEWKSTEYGA